MDCRASCRGRRRLRHVEDMPPAWAAADREHVRGQDVGERVADARRTTRIDLPPRVHRWVLSSPAASMWRGATLRSTGPWRWWNRDGLIVVSRSDKRNPSTDNSGDSEYANRWIDFAVSSTVRGCGIHSDAINCPDIAASACGKSRR
jgi:hypothetical protein